MARKPSEVVKHKRSALERVKDAAEKQEPRLVTLEEAERLLEESTSPEARMPFAKPFPIWGLGFEVMVAPAVGLEPYEAVFGGMDNLMRGDFNEEDAKKRCGIEVIKLFIKACVIKPELNDAFLDGLLSKHPQSFSLLAQFCQQITLQDTTEGIAERLGCLDTEAQQAFFVSMAGSTNTPMPT